MSLLLGAIADDFTGATDLANILARSGMRVIQTIGLPKGKMPAADAIVVALKSRTIPVVEAVDQSVAACRWLKVNGAQQIFFKYCSTFDSTSQGNIGPVADALMQELATDFTIACPAFPENKRTIYMGHLFVGDVLLSDSSMRHHPLTPMTDSNLVHVLAQQTKHQVGLVPFATVAKGASAITHSFAKLREGKTAIAIVDAVTDEDLRQIGEACASLPLVTGGSGVAMGLPQNYRKMGLLPKEMPVQRLSPVGGRSAVLAGSCSAATLEQVQAFAGKHTARRIDPLAVSKNAQAVVSETLAWAEHEGERGPVLIYSSATPEAVAKIQASLGRDVAGQVIEQVMSKLAKGLVASGVRRLVVAGGETSGAVVSALGVESLEIGQQIAPGVPATRSTGTRPLGLVLKSAILVAPTSSAKLLRL